MAADKHGRPTPFVPPDDPREWWHWFSWEGHWWSIQRAIERALSR